MASKNPVSSGAQVVSRRVFLIAGVLTACAGAGIVTGGATSFALKQRGAGIVSSGVPVVPVRQKQPQLRQMLLFTNHQRRVRAASWSPDGALIASGADDASLLLWTPDGQLRQQIIHPQGVAALAWSPDGKRFVFSMGSQGPCLHHLTLPI